MGRPLRRIYGDFSGSRLKPWAGILAKHAIIPQQQFAYTTGKNGSDIVLVIHAMDLLHSGRFDGFCLVSSASDFTRLAVPVREQGFDVLGFGEQKTPESFRQACRRFIFTENLLQEARALEPDAGKAAKPLRPASAAVPLLKKVLSQIESEDGRISPSALGNRLASIAPGFDSRTYGYCKLSDLVRKAGAFEVDLPEGGALRVRLKAERPKKKANQALSR